MIMVTVLITAVHVYLIPLVSTVLRTFFEREIEHNL